MELYRFSLVAIVCLMGYVALQQFSIRASGKHPRLHLIFGLLASSIFLHDILWLVRLEQSQIGIAHTINMLQWLISWAMLFLLTAFVDHYIYSRLTWLSKSAGIFCGIQCALVILLPGGSYYSGAPYIQQSVLPWGETILAPNYQGKFTPLYWLVIAITFSYLIAAFLLALRSEKISLHFQRFPTLTLAMGAILIGVFHDTLVDLAPYQTYPIRLAHAGTVLLLLVMNHSLTTQIYRVARLHDQLRESEERLHLMVDNVPGVLYRLRFTPDGQSEVMSISGRIGEIFGEIPPGRGIMEHFVMGLLPPDRDRCLAISADTRKNNAAFSFEGRYQSPSGELKWLRLCAQPTAESDGSVIYAGIILDETLQWQTRQEQERLTLELQHSTEEQEAMLYVASHDLRAPLLNIRGFSAELRTSLDAIQKTMSGTNPDLQAEALSINESLMYIDKSAERMSRLLDGLLLVSRSRRIPMEPERLEMSTILQSVFGIYQFRIRQLDAEIHTSPLPDCYADANMMTQIWGNLLDNALKYRHPERKPVIEIKGFLEGESSVYEIHDNGVGFPQQYSQTLFRLFHRLNPSSDIEGTGVGLTIVQRFLHRMGGSIEATSIPNQGTTFTLRLPRQIL